MGSSPHAICIVASFALPHLGGVERYAHQMAKQFVKHGLPAVVVCLNTEGERAHEFVDGVEYFRLPCFVILRGRYPIPLLNLHWFQLVREIRKRTFSRVIINVRFYLLSIMAAKAADRKSCPIFLIEHGTSHFQLGNALLTKLAAFYEHWITNRLKQKITHFFGVSEACNRWLLHFGIQSGGVLYNGVDSEDIPAIDVSWSEKLSLPNDSLVISYVGRLVAEKGVLNLVSAVTCLNSDDHPAQLFIAGNGPLEDLIPPASYVHFLGSIEHQEVFQLLAITDILVLPSAFPEGLPTILLEAGLMGNAIVATPMGGTEELIPDLRYGLIIPNNEVSSIRNALQRLIDDPEMRRKMGENLKNRVREEFSWEKTAFRMFEFFGIS